MMYGVRPWARSSSRSGVGAYASSTRGIGGADVAIETTISGEEVAWQGMAAGHRLPEQLLHHQGVAHRVIAVVVVERDVDLLSLAGGLVDLRHQLAQLRLAVEVVVLLAHGGLLTAQLAHPALGVAAVQAEDGDGRRHFRHARHETRRATSAGSDCARGWWPVISAHALTWKTKPGGVRSAQRRTLRTSGIA